MAAGDSEREAENWIAWVPTFKNDAYYVYRDAFFALRRRWVA